jgi:hypothetical protein
VTGRPLGALLGAGSFAVATAGTLVHPTAPGPAARPAAIAAFYRDHGGALLVADTLYLLAGVLLLGFAAVLSSLLRRAEGADGRLATAAFGGAVAGTALTIAGAAVDATAALRAGAGDGIDPTVATVLWDLGAALHGLAAPMAYAVPVLATAVLSARTALLPAWHAALGCALAIGLLSTPISHLAIVAFGFWVLLTSLLLTLAEPPRPPIWTPSTR